MGLDFVLLLVYFVMFLSNGAGPILVEMNSGCQGKEQTPPVDGNMPLSLSSIFNPVKVVWNLARVACPEIMPPSAVPKTGHKVHFRWVYLPI